MKWRRKQKQKVKTRDHQTKNMILHTKPGPMKDRKKQENKEACRKKVEVSLDTDT